MRTACLITALVTFLSMPSGALAGTVSVVEDDRPAPKGSLTVDTVRYVAAPREENHVRAVMAERTATIIDAAGVTPGSGCRLPDPADPTRAVCDDLRMYTEGYAELFVLAGDGNDVVVIDPSSARALVEGGDGDDALTAGGGDYLEGGPGADALEGSPGGDRLEGGPGGDHIRGGGGPDALSYEGHAIGVHVDLTSTHPAGAPGEGDRIEGSFGAILGGSGDDVLIGDPDRHTRLIGSGGDDRLISGAGNDVLNGGPGNDRLTSGAGNDALDGEGGADRLDAGAGKDSVSDQAVGSRSRNRVDAGPGEDLVQVYRGPAVIDAGSGEDEVFGFGEEHLIRARDGSVDEIGCEFLGKRGGRVLVDARDFAYRCGEVRRTAAAAPVIRQLGPRLPERHIPSRLGVDIGCSDDVLGGCAGSVVLRGPSGTVGRRPFRAGPGESTGVRFELDPSLRQTLRRRCGRGLVVVLITRDVRGRRRLQRRPATFAVGRPGTRTPC